MKRLSTKETRNQLSWIMRNIAPNELTWRNKSKGVLCQRQAFINALFECGYSKNMISEAVGIHRATIIHAVRKDEDYKANKEMGVIYRSARAMYFKRIKKLHERHGAPHGRFSTYSKDFGKLDVFM